VDRARIRQRKGFQLILSRGLLTSLVAVVVLIAIFVLFSARNTLASAIANFMVPSPVIESGEAISTSTVVTGTPSPVPASSSTVMPASVSGSESTPTSLLPTATIDISPTFTSTATEIVSAPTSTPSPLADFRPETYTLQPGEFPYCIARRFDVHPNELLALNGLVDHQVFYAGTVLTIPQSGNPFPGNRMLQPHPTTYTVSNLGETIYGVACLFGNIDPVAIAQANDIPLGSTLFVGQQLKIP